MKLIAIILINRKGYKAKKNQQIQLKNKKSAEVTLAGPTRARLAELQGNEGFLASDAKLLQILCLHLLTVPKSVLCEDLV